MAETISEARKWRLTYAIDGVPCYAELVEKGTRLTGLPRPSKPGCTFGGWGEVPSRMPGHDLTLDGHFIENTYRVVFVSGVEQYGVSEQVAGSPLKAPPAPEKEGYEFGGWAGFTGIAPYENTTYEAIFTPRTYRLTYVIDGAVRFPFAVPFGSPVPRLDAPTKHNYVFSGWEEIPETMPAQDVTVHGSFSERLYTLSMVVDGEVFLEKQLPVGTPVDKKVKPQKEGYYFSGWRKLPDKMPAHDVTVAASMYPARYKIDYFLGEELFRTVYYPFGEAVTAPVPECGDNMLFSGWDALPETMPARDLSVRGTVTPRLYSLTFRADGRMLARVELPAGAPIPQDVEVPSKNGYAFCGWQDAPAAMPASDLDLDAVYAAVKAKYVFVIDGEVYAEETPGEGESLSMPVPPPKDGVPFGGWGAMKLDPRTGVTTFTGTYGKQAAYTLVWSVRGEVIDRSRVAAGTPLTPPTPPHRDEYEFLGWEDYPDVMPERDLRIEARVRLLHYRLQFIADGEVLYSMSLDEGGEISCPAVAPRRGFTFAGWQDAPATMPAHDLDIYGTFTRNSYRLTWRVDGETVSEETVPYEAPLTPPDVPAMKDEKYPFMGWSETLTEMPDHDVTLDGGYADTVCVMSIYVNGIETETRRARVGDPVILPEIPSEPGETFAWDKIPATYPEGRTEVHGGHIAIPYKVRYYSKGVLLGEETYHLGETIQPKVEPPKQDGVFRGWEGLPEVMPAEDLKVEANFATRTYHVTFMLENRLFTEADVPAGAPTPNPEVPEKDGYRFDGWRNYVSVMPPYNFTAYGTYCQQKYVITYISGTDIVAKQEYAFGAQILPPPAPVREHYEFRAWEGLPSAMPAHDLMVSARYQGQLFRISYLIDGSLVSFRDVELGSHISPPEAPAREGFVFSGWKNLPEFMPEHELIVTGEYEERSHTVTYKVGGIIYHIDTYDAGAKITPPEAPEHEHETFVRWRNFTDTMPDYDFTCVAEYSEAYGHYSFVLEGDVLAEGVSRKGEKLTPPEVPHRSGFAFQGWNGFTGVMPGQDVVYIGGFVTDTFKVFYRLDGELYHEDGYNEGDTVYPADPPERDGFHFSGWSKIPAVMPADDVEVTGRMIPEKFRLTYIAGGTTIYDALTDCGTPLGLIGAPEIHGLTFNGWQDEPEKMPPYPLTVTGTYLPSEPRYVGITAGDIAEGNTVLKSPPVAPNGMAFVFGSSLRILIDDICYPVAGSQNCMANGRVFDFGGLCTAIRRTYHKYGLPKRKLQLVVCDGFETDQIFDTRPVPLDTLSRAAAEIFSQNPYGENAKYQFFKMSENKTVGTDRMLVSMLDNAACGTLAAAFKRAGVTIHSAGTLVGALTRYLQLNKKMVREKNQICLFYLPNAIVATLMIGGQVAYVARNLLPYADRKFPVREETQHMLGLIASYAESIGFTQPIHLVLTGGIDRTHAREGQRCAPALLRDIAHASRIGVFGGSRFKRPALVNLGFAHTENRTK